VSVGYNASGNVIRNGKARDLNLDHHSRSPFENLYEDIDMGAASYPYLPVSGAGGDPLRSGARGTVWNVSTSKGPVAPPPFAYVQFNVIGTTQSKMTADREWLEILDPVVPADLYLSQLHKRLGNTSAVEMEPPLRQPSLIRPPDRSFDIMGRDQTRLRVDKTGHFFFYLLRF
jgi:hypothetical protein